MVNKMVLASSYPFLEVFWTMLIFFAFVVWLWLLFTVIGDIFSRHDTSGFMKVIWLIFIIVLPYFGVFIYLIAEQRGMTERALARQEKMQSRMAASVSPSATDQVEKAKALLDSGAITQAEFDALKQTALGAS